MKPSPVRNCSISAQLILHASFLKKLRSRWPAGIWLFSTGILVLVGSIFAPAHAQVVLTVAGGASPNPAPSENVCTPIRAAAAHGSDIYLVSCDRIYKVSMQGTWTLVAGNGIDAFSGDGGPATSASLGQPESIALDTGGNLYILDSHNRRVREVSASTGIIQTIAGTGVGGFGGDGGPATFSRIGGYGAITVDTQGNVFLADELNNLVREIVASTGFIQTVVGQLSLPLGVSVDSSGNVFIADTGHHRILELTGGLGGAIQTVAGNGTAGFAGDGGTATSAELYYPYGVFVDNSGNIFVADTANNRIRQVTAGIITTIAGSGAANPSSCNTSFDQCIGDGGPAISAIVPSPLKVFKDNSGNLFFLSLVDELQEIRAGTVNIQTFAANGATGFGGDGGPAAQAQLYLPADAVADKVGNIYIADIGAVRKVVAATVVIQTIAGIRVGGATSLSGDGGPAASATTSPNGLFVDTAGNVFVADAFNEVREISAATGTIRSVAGNGAAGYSGDGGPATNAQLNYPSSVFVDAAGNIFIADANNSVIREVIGGPGGNIVTVAGNGTPGYSGDGGLATNAQLAYPSGVYVDPSGNIFVADGNNVIREVVAGTNIIQTVAGNGLDGYNGDNIPATMATLNGTTGVYGDTLGNIYVPDPINNIVRAFTVGGNIHTVVGNRVQGFGGDGGGALAAELDSPIAVFVEPSGTLIITDTANHRIRVLGPAPSGNASSTTISASPNPSIGGQNVTFTAAVGNSAGGAPTGTVNFLDNGTQIGSVALNNGQATFITSSLAVGSHTISAQFAGNSTFASSTSASLTETVNAAAFGPAPANMPTVTAGQSVTFALTMYAAPGSNLSFTMACLGLPANSSCSFSPNPFAPAPPPNGSQVQVTFSTQAASALVNIPRQRIPLTGNFALLGFVGLLAAIGGLFGRCTRSSGRFAWTTAAVVLATALVGCGGGSNPSTPLPLTGGTPKGIANITVSATSGSTTLIKTIPVNVQ